MLLEVGEADALTHCNELLFSTIELNKIFVQRATEPKRDLAAVQLFYDLS